MPRPPHPSAPSSILGRNILLSTLFSDTVNLYSSLSVRDQVSHPCKTTKLWLCFSLQVLREETGRQDFEQNGSKHSPNLICSLFLHECNFDLVVSFPNIWISLRSSVV
jgi:hypothetical protein